MKIRCVNKQGIEKYLPEHLTKDVEFMNRNELTIQDPSKIELKGVKVESTVEQIDTITDEEIVAPVDLFSTEAEQEKPKEKKQRKTKNK
jgi:hypothetical protein